MPYNAEPAVSGSARIMASMALALGLGTLATPGTKGSFLAKIALMAVTVQS
jgi:hypothetical protein